MFRAIQDFDGSTTSKCICLAVGDMLSEVHALNEIWFVGHNTNTGETGVFPAACVDPEIFKTGSVFGVPATEHADTKPRARTLSAGAKTFDTRRLTSTKPEKVFRLKLLSGVDANSQTEPSSNLHSSTVVNDKEEIQKIFSLDQQDTTESVFRQSWMDSSFEHSGTASPHSDHAGGACGPDKADEGWYPVEDEGCTVSDFDTSWMESTFEKSYIASTALDKPTKPVDSKEDGKYHRFASDIDEYTITQGKSWSTAYSICLGLGSLSLYIIVFYLLLVYCYGYKHLEAAIMVVVTAVVLAVLFCVLQVVRTASVLIWPHLLSGAGNHVLFTALLGLLLTNSVVNIIYNIRETGNSMACFMSLVAQQRIAARWNLVTPYDDTTEFINKQRDNLDRLDTHSSTFGEVHRHLNMLTEQFVFIEKTLENVTRTCQQSINIIVNQCTKTCNTGSIVNTTCIYACSRFFNSIRHCDAVLSLAKQDKAFTDARNATRKLWTTVNQTKELFHVDLRAQTISLHAYNSSNETSTRWGDLTGSLRLTSVVADVTVRTCAKVLAISVLVLCCQTFMYFRQYSSNDDFDNHYIIKTYKKRSPGYLRQYIFQGPDELVDTTSYKMSRKEKKDMIESFINLSFYVVIICVFGFIEWISCYSLNAIRKVYFMTIKRNSLSYVTVEGFGPVADYLQLLYRGANINDVFLKSVYADTCLPQSITHEVGFCVVLATVVIVMLCVALGQGHSRRIRRQVASYLCPTQEAARMAFFHVKAQHTTVCFYAFVRHYIRSKIKERLRLQYFDVTRWLGKKLGCFERCAGSDVTGSCLLCGNNGFSNKCPESGDSCPAEYCQQCWEDIGQCCPVCTK